MEKVTGLRDMMICIVVIFPVCKVLMCTIIMKTLWGAAYDPAVKYVTHYH